MNKDYHYGKSCIVRASRRDVWISSFYSAGKSVSEKIKRKKKENVTNVVKYKYIHTRNKHINSLPVHYNFYEQNMLAWRKSLARRPRPGVLQAGTDSSPVSERLRTAVPVGLLRSDRRCRQSAAPAFRQPSTACSTSLPAQHLRPSGLFSCRLHSLELSPGFHPGPDHHCRLFQTFAQKRTCSLDTGAFSALEVLDDNHAQYIYLLKYN